ncbi:DUF7524 family protein [Halobaculum limi]|uniref:DUF7524 family protein n=1 Tax=Halobaculum limi TaxID=3031916 RepID=UPI002406B63D|nr:hypothetical protein [Halobaculum sp. YSMS11]
MSSEGDPLGVTLNRDRLNEATAPDTYRADGDFAVELRNEGAPVHVHLRFQGPLAAVASVANSNYYVDEGATSAVGVSVADIDESVEGAVEIVTGHGADGTSVAVTVDPPPAPVDVDESFGSPRAAQRATAETNDDESGENTGGPTLPDLGSRLPDTGTLSVVAIAVAALLGAGVVAVTLDGLAVTLGVVAVLVAVVVAMFLLLEN